MSYNPDVELQKLARENRKLFFYTSCGVDSSKFNELDYDVYIFSDYLDPYYRNKDGRARFWDAFKNNLGCEIELVAATERTRVFRSGKKWGFLFFQDNNIVLDRIIKSGNRIACFCGVCCGCSEGGNYECVNEPKFLHKVLQAAHPDGMEYITDHSTLLADPSQLDEDTFEYGNLYFYKELILGNYNFILDGSPKLGNGLLHRQNSRGDNRTTYFLRSEIRYRVRKLSPEVYQWNNDKLKITIEHDSIVNHSKSLDGYFVGRHCHKINNYCFPEKKTHFVSTGFFKPSRRSGRHTTKSSIKLLLRKANENKWDTIGTTAFGEGNHDEILDVVNKWEGGYPKWIRIFHLDAGDFSDLKGTFRKITV